MNRHRFVNFVATAVGAGAIAAMSLACSRVPSPLTPTFTGSVGLPHQGVLSQPVRLPAQGPGYRCIRSPQKRFGTHALVQTVQYASARVQELCPGEPLLVGDLSAETGGKIPNHASHRNGRDVDLLFYTVDLDGAPIQSPGFVTFGPDGLARAPRGKGSSPYVQFDVKRNWLLVRSLLEAPSAQVLWLFVSKPLESLMTEYAIATGEDPVLIWQAENVMLQPRNALPHDDHFHLRIACTPDSRALGCEDGGPYWPWFDKHQLLEWPAAEEQISAFIEVDSLPPL